MIWNLIRKELVEHGWVFALLLPATLFGFFLVLAGALLNEAGSALEAVRFFCLTLLVLIELVICNRLVVQEYSGKTQLFLEGLPISRSTMLWTKYLLGFSIVTAVMACCFLIALAAAFRQEIIDLRFVAIMLSRLTVFVFVSYSFFFMTGLLGRYRIPLYVVLFLSMVILHQTTALDVTEHGPIGLLNDQFAFERNDFPIRYLAECSIAGCTFIAIAMLMGLVREGSVASLLAERMSRREKLFATVAIVTMVFAGSMIDEKQTPDPYIIPNAYIRNDDAVAVHVETVEDREVAGKLADQVHGDLLAVRDYLAIEIMPDLFIVNRRDLDADRYEPARLENASGTLIRANYASPEWSYEEFRTFLIDVSLSHVSNFNVIYEPQCWVLEGFSEYWPRRQSSDPQWTDAPVDLRAAYGASLGFVESDIDDWYRFRERVGEPIARSVACSGLVFAERQHGADRLRAFLREIMRTDQPSDVRADMTQLSRPIADVWQRTMGSDYRKFRRDWVVELGLLTKASADRLQPIPHLTAQASVLSKSTVTYDITITPASNPPPKDGNIAVRFEEVSIYDRWDSDRRAETQIELYKPSKAITLNKSFSAGGRLRWTASVFVPQLDCDVISGWQRQEVK